MSELPTAWFEAQSRELALACARDGVVLWLDARARRHLQLSEGENLLVRVAPGTEAKAEALLSRGAEEELTRWELPVVVGERVVTVLFCARPHRDAVVLHGSLVPEDFAAVAEQVNEAMAEIVQLNRQVARQRRELAERNDALTRVNRELSDAHRGVLALLRELEERADTLRRVAEARRRVVAHVSHEFRTPVGAIQSLSRMLLAELDGPLHPEQRQQVHFIESSAVSLSRLVDDILDLSRIESGKSVLRSERFSLVEFVASVRGILRPLLPEGGAVQLIFDPVPPEAELETDSGKLGQIVRNLVSNAIKFTEAGEIRVSMTLSDGDLELRVKDTGIGIAPEEQARVFEEFGQVASAQKPKLKGTGLGLPLSRALAVSLGGTLTLASERGKGSTFTLRLPRIHPDVTALAALTARPLDPARLPLLVLEDDREALLAYAQSLEPSGVQVIPARTVEEARAALTRLRPSAILLDVLLEGETSWDFLRELKQSQSLRRIPVFVATIADREATALGLGADGFFLKPLDPAALLARLKTANPR